MRRQLLSTVYGTLLLGSALLSGCASVSKTAPMPGSPMGDKDLAAVLGFMRSPPPLFEADASEFLGADGKPIHSSNLTFDATGLQGWSLEDFTRTAPEATAPSAQATPASVSTQAVEPGSPVRTSATAELVTLVLAQAEPKKDVDPAALFARLGCTLCHAPGARYHERIVNAASKSEQDLAKWIRNPEQFTPGTTMPTYASLIDEPTALALARWIKSGGPAARK
jgi:cytochrome c551/c552